jgi:hypothetical protein
VHDQEYKAEALFPGGNTGYKDDDPYHPCKSVSQPRPRLPQILTSPPVLAKILPPIHLCNSPLVANHRPATQPIDNVPSPKLSKTITVDELSTVDSEASAGSAFRSAAAGTASRAIRSSAATDVAERVSDAARPSACASGRSSYRWNVRLTPA